MKRITVKSVRNLITKAASIVRKEAGPMEIAKAIVEDPKTRSVYVIDSDRKLLGIIPVINFTEYLFYEYVPDQFLYYKAIKPLEEITAEDIMLPPTYVKESDGLDVAFQKMFGENLKELPVVDDEMHVIGDLNILELVAAWIKENS
jgi:CBS domain-containing protein